MTSLFSAQRAAEEFDRVLGGTATRAVSERHADLLDTVAVLRAQPEVLPRAELVADLRSRLMTAAETELVAAPRVVRRLPPARSPRNRRLGTVAASLVIVGGSAGMAAAASGSLPGESLYPIKRGVEQASTAVHFSDVSKGKALLGQAATRLEEVRDLQAQGSPDTGLIATTLDSFRSAADAGSEKLFTAYQANGDTEDIATVRTFTAQQMNGVAALSGSSASTDALLVDAADTLSDIDQQARVLCGACDPQETLSPPGTLTHGAAAATVDSLLARPVAQAQTDITDAANAEAARIATLKAAAEKSAGDVPVRTGAEPGTRLSTSPTRDRAVTSTVSPDGKLIPSLTTGAAVQDLVSGVTGSLTEVTGLPGKLTGKITGKATGPGATTLDQGVQGLDDTVEGLTDQLLPDQ